MHKEVVALYQSARKYHEEAYKAVLRLDELVKSCNNVEELADFAYALREAARYTHDTKSSLERVQTLAERIACLLYVKGEMGGPIKTSHCSATPKIKMMASLPKKSTHPEEYAALMAHLGIPDSVAGSEAVRLHWPGFTDYLSEQIEKGLPVPPGLEKTYPVYSLTIRRRLDADDVPATDPEEEDAPF